MRANGNNPHSRRGADCAGVRRLSQDVALFSLGNQPRGIVRQQPAIGQAARGGGPDLGDKARMIGVAFFQAGARIAAGKAFGPGARERDVAAKQAAASSALKPRCTKLRRKLPLCELPAPTAQRMAEPVASG